MIRGGQRKISPLAAFEELVPQAGRYKHEETWHDDNGNCRMIAALLGPALSVHIVNERLTLGRWQQIALADFDTRTRTGTIICQIIRE